MSYILEALKKSDRERQMSGAPNVVTDPYPTAPRGHSWTFWAVLGLVMLNSAGLATLYLSRQREDAPAVVQNSPPPVVAPITAASPAPRASQVEAVATTPAVEPDADTSIAVIATPEKLRSKADTPAVSVAGSETQPDLVPTSIPEKTVQTATPEPTDVVLDKAAGNIPTLAEMSPEFQATVPVMNLDVHVYDKRPEKRFVLINSKRLTDGEAIADGLRLERIVAKGVILSKSGIMFSLSAGE